jgi:hypothetical protein
MSRHFLGGFVRLVGGGAFISTLSGLASIFILAFVQRKFGPSEAGLYVFSSALATQVGAALALGIPEYGQVLGAGRALQPANIAVAIAGIFLCYFSGQLVRWGEVDQVQTLIKAIYFFLVLAFVGVVLTVGDLFFRYRQIHSLNVRNYFISGGVPLVASVFLYLAVGEGGNLRSCIGFFGLLAACAIAIKLLRNLPVPCEITFWRIQKAQFGFFGQRLLLVFVDTALVVTAHKVLSSNDYVRVGFLARAMSPFFLLFNVYVGQRQAQALISPDVGKRIWWHLWGACVLLAIGTYVKLACGADRVWALFFATLLVRYWVVALALEFQQWLPASPMRISVPSFFIWGFGAFAYSTGRFQLLDMAMILVSLNLTIVGLLSYLYQVIPGLRSNEF